MADDIEEFEDEPEDSERPETDIPNAADPKALKKQRRKRVAEADEEAEVIRSILSTKQGRRWYARLIHETFGLYQITANAAFDANGQHFKEGARAVGLTLHNKALQASRDQYMVLLTETLV